MYGLHEAIGKLLYIRQITQQLPAPGQPTKDNPETNQYHGIYITLFIFCKPYPVKAGRGNNQKDVNILENLYIVKTRMSSPNYILYSEEIDDMTSQYTYKFNKETRQQISAIRGRYHKPVYEGTANFHGLYICQEKHMKELQDIIFDISKRK